jgi:glycerophosphoryl diester phosphodiesterase
MICFGHRGACGHEPENTVRSVRRALELGAQGIEVDVRNVDGELLVFHDARLERTTDGRGYLTRQPLEYLRTLNAGCGERIPTLREICTAIDRRAVLNIELKGRRTAGLVASLIEDLVRSEGWSFENFIVSSFLRRELAQLRRLGAAEIPVGLLLARPTRFYPRAARLLRATSIHPALRYVTERLVNDAHADGRKVYVYTVNEPQDLERMRALGVDGVFTDFPERVCGQLTG